MSVHIYRAAETTTEAETEQLAALDKYQRRYLSRRSCMACEWPLDRPGCGTYGEYPANPCAEDGRIDRRARCLEEYKPRGSRRGKKPGDNGGGL